MALLKLSNLVHLYRVRLRARWVQELLAVVGIAVGVALLFAASVANTSLIGSVTQLSIAARRRCRACSSWRAARRLRRAASLREVQDIAGRAVRGARARAFMRRWSVRRANDRSFSSGPIPRFARPRRPLLRRFRTATAAEQLADAKISRCPRRSPTSLGVSADDRCASGRQTQHVVPIGRAAAPRATSGRSSTTRSRSRRLPSRSARRDAGPRDADLRRLESWPRRAGRAALLDVAAGRLNVRAADFDVCAVQAARRPTSQSTALFSAFSALVGFLFAFSAMLLTVPQRRRLIVDLRLAGHEPWVVIQVLLFDALVLGAAGRCSGSRSAIRLSRHLFRDVPGYLACASRSARSAS